MRKGLPFQHVLNIISVDLVASIHFFCWAKSTSQNGSPFRSTKSAAVPQLFPHRSPPSIHTSRYSATDTGALGKRLGSMGRSNCSWSVTYLRRGGREEWRAAAPSSAIRPSCRVWDFRASRSQVNVQEQCRSRFAFSFSGFRGFAPHFSSIQILDQPA